jgi:anti-sigma28 factor (negative regulator of flagellin synthesis)
MESTETLAGDSPQTVSRRERLEELSHLIAEGKYVVSAIDIAHAILHGRPKWGNRVPRPGDLRSVF